MTDTTGVLASIDGALRDYGTSDDAMRWSPEPAPQPPPADLAALARICQPVMVNIVLDLSGFAFERMGAALAQALIPATKRASAALSAFAHDLDRQERPRWHKTRCPRCNPWGNPPPAAGWYKPGPKASRMRGRRKR